MEDPSRLFRRRSGWPRPPRSRSGGTRTSPRRCLEQTQRASIRERDLPAHVVVYYVIALALYMRSSYREVLRCLSEGVQWMLDPSTEVNGGRQVGHLRRPAAAWVRPARETLNSMRPSWHHRRQGRQRRLNARC